MRRFVHDFLKWLPIAIGGGAISISAVWVEAKDWVATNVAWLWSQMTSPWIAIFVFLSVAAYVAAIVWTGQVKNAPAPLSPEVNTALAISDEAAFKTAILKLRHIVNARELWNIAVRRRDGQRSKIKDQLLDAITEIRHRFPPSTSGDLEKDDMARLTVAAQRYSQQLGYSHGETDRLKTARDQFEIEVQATEQRFAAMRESKTPDGGNHA